VNCCRGCSAISSPYLIPLGVIFIVMIIFLAQRLLGFARWLLNK